MRLKTLELQGFKSFPEKTRLDFNSGMTAIVGPNGSGKSNISDAIRWVLGEISSKNIRGSKMEDVIFSGTGARRPMGWAEVSLTFDNTEGDMKLPLDYDEVTITRKFYRSGESEYMINHKPVRLRDITELFMNTGLGRSGYSIIGQGRIAEIISKKSEDRRGIFEEAAGIAKYRFKKTEAEHKLSETAENLDRVSDILSELSSRVGPLEADSIKAKKYLELYDAKKKADVSIWLYEINNIKSRTEKLTAEYEISKHELEIADDTITALESRSEKLFTLSQENRLRSETNTRLISEHENKKHEAESSELLLKNDIEHFASEFTLAMAEADAKNASKQKALAETQRLSQLLLQENEKLDRLNHELDENAKKLYEIRASIEDKTVEIEGLEKSEDEKSALLVNAKLELSSLDGIKDMAGERRDELREQSGALLERIRQNGEKIIESKKTLALYSEKIAGVRDNIALLADKAEKLNSEKTEKTSHCDKHIAELGSVSGRLEALRRMEDHFDGYINSVKYIMERASAGSINGICGPVSKLISVNPDLVVAIETALGSNMQNIVVESESAAKSAIRMLKESGAGRATFYPLDTISAMQLNADTSLLKQQRGYVGVANELIGCDRRYKNVIDYLLARTVICDNIDNAADISRKFGYKFKAVTLDGQVINAGGSFTGGSVRRDSGILTRSSEISNLEMREKEIKNSISTLRGEIKNISERINELDGQKTSASSELDILNIMNTSEDTQLKILESQLSADNNRLEELSKSKNSLEEQEKDYQTRRSALLEKVRAGELALEEVQRAKLLAGEEERGITDTLNSAIDEKNALLITVSAKKKDILHAESEISRVKDSIAVIDGEIASCKTRLTEIEQKKHDAQTTIANSQGTLSGIEEEISRLKKESETLRQADLEFEKQTAQLRTEIKDKNHHREILFRDFTRLEAKMAGVTSEQDKFTSKLWDEYELTYQSATELGYPKVTDDTRGQAASDQTKLKNRIHELGPVNIGAIEEYKQVKERYDFLSGQFTDLTSSKEDLNNVIFKLEREMRSRFSDVFDRINENFKVVFSELFGGGTAELTLTDPENILECGIEINVAPPGKIIKNLTLLSGGEQVFVAIALFFAILKVTPAPFCLLDEIEAALDEVNVARFAAYAKRYSDKTQFIVITHRRGTMEESDRLYGVTMPERGISRILTLNINEVEQKIGVKI